MCVCACEKSNAMNVEYNFKPGGLFYWPLFKWTLTSLFIWYIRSSAERTTRSVHNSKCALKEWFVLRVWCFFPPINYILNCKSIHFVVSCFFFCFFPGRVMTKGTFEWKWKAQCFWGLLLYIILKLEEEKAGKAIGFWDFSETHFDAFSVYSPAFFTSDVSPCNLIAPTLAVGWVCNVIV